MVTERGVVGDFAEADTGGVRGVGRGVARDRGFFARGGGRVGGREDTGGIGRLERGGVDGELNGRDAKGDVHRPTMEPRALVEPGRTLPVVRLPSPRAWSRAVRRAVSPRSLSVPGEMRVQPRGARACAVRGRRAAVGSGRKAEGKGGADRTGAKAAAMRWRWVDESFHCSAT